MYKRQDTLRRKIHTLKENVSEPSTTDLEDMELAMDTIHRRSEGLLRFAETYRNLSQKIVPDMKSVSYTHLFEKFLENTITFQRSIQSKDSVCAGYN